MTKNLNNLFQLPSQLQPIDLGAFGIFNKQVFIKRDDLIHPIVSGNKWRKLKYNIQEYFAGNYTGIVTFGGAHSNHIIATSYLANFCGIPTIIIIRGEEPKKLSPTLKKCKNLGVQLNYVTREAYKSLINNAELIDEQYLNYFVIPEGGANVFGIKGCEDIVEEINIDFDELYCDVGTGATLVGIARKLKTHQSVRGVVVLKGAEYLNNLISNLASKKTYTNKIKLFHNYHFGGYAKNNKELVLFMRKFYDATGIKTDPIYSAKMFYGMVDQLKLNNNEKTIIALHSGGLQGIEGFEERYKLKIYK